MSLSRRNREARSRLWWLSILAVFAIMAASCGSDGDDTEESDGATEASVDDATVDAEPEVDDASVEDGEPAEDDVDLDGQSVEVLGIRGSDDPEGAALIAALETFTANTGVEVDYQAAGDDTATVISTRVEGGSPPDVALLAQPGLVTDLVSRGALVSIEDGAGASLDANFASAWRDLGTRDGELYGLFIKAANKSTVFYRLDTFAELGLEPPSTLEEWVALNSTLVDNGFTPLAVGGADGWTLSDWFENFYIRTAGVDNYDALTAHEIPWTDDSVVEALAAMEQVIGSDELIAGGRDGALQMGFNDSIVSALGTSPEAVMVYEGDFIAGIAPEEAGTQAGVDWDFFPFPSVNGSPGAVVGAGDLAVAFSDSPATQALIEFLASAEFANLMIPNGGFASPNNAADLSLYPDEISRQSAEALVNAETFVFDMSDLSPAALGATPGSGIWGGLQNWLQNPGDVDDVLATLEADAATAFDN